MFLLFAGGLLLIVLGLIALQFVLKVRSLRSAEAGRAASMAPDRYRPMLRLLSDDDFTFISDDSKLQRQLRTKRRALFRGYLSCLTRDYAHLLACVRQAMVQSGVDRPDLARALAKNRVLFAIAICKVELRLALHATGFGRVDISGLVNALETLRSQVSVMPTASFSTANMAT
jgi:hypothetical protein